ncbi:MAG: bifunctional phosphopantothenoylcysteine decarboxylase/phosphopantothenate--cysteine ligase CoaBC [Flavobacteriales bacterium]|nr:bifunctional phosphopantothenoylcysteine decarboxylase/phosphopantothenate--cysteine ligase CoaBC [Flavobacteriales bacterium]MCB9168203.1 bifunctional phosphopantothenoylcysteine decarboxylase/phosphopantothenate--cysteine ligase CoaBC [Flavobacteriales bacterium]
MSYSLPRRILLGVTGGIAAYKSAALVRELVRAGADVRVVMTPAAHDFITPLTLATLSRHEVLTDLVDRSHTGTWNDHVALARWADVFLFAPATAHTLAKMAHGLGDNLLLACWLSATCPVFVAPAMDLEMYRDPAVQANLAALKARNVHVIGPDTGELASGLIGEGRMSAPEDIVAALCDALIGRSALAGRRILVTAGPTQEAIDPVRYIGNRSSGKMGLAIAQAAIELGAKVTLVAGPVLGTVALPLAERVDVMSAAEMAKACKDRFADQDVVIMAAAVADFRPADPADRKIKKSSAARVLTLEPTEDILAWMGAGRRKEQFIVGFALETGSGLAHAREKLMIKRTDMLVLNTLADDGAGFGHDTNKVTFLFADNTEEALPLMSKTDVARRLMERIADRIAT